MQSVGPQKKALILGLGASGIACARFLARRDWQLSVADTRVCPGLLGVLRDELPLAQFHGGSLPIDLLEQVDLLVISPGLSPDHSEAAPLVAKARDRGIDVVGEIELFARELIRLKAFRAYDPKIIGITGTNGKTTTTMLTTAMVKESGRSVCFAGNVGPNALTELLRHLEANTLPDVWVLELSSFQLETTSSLVCTSAAVLNVTQDHLDWHGSMERYAKAKERIFSPNTIRVLNRDDAICQEMARHVEARRLFTYGADAPKTGNSFGLVQDGCLLWLSAWLDETPNKPRRQKEVEGSQPHEVSKVELMPENALLIRGRHNSMNALAAITLALASGIELTPILNALSVYRGEPHRVQSILEASGVEYIDDSKGTNVGATVAAIEGFGQRKLEVILGGLGKGQDFTPLAQPIAKHARGVVLIGADAKQIEHVLKDSGVPIVHAKTLPEAVRAARSMAKEGDAVLLSPACASMDMFRDYAHRSEVFVQAAKEIALEEGQPC